MLTYYHRSVKAKTATELEDFKPGIWVYCESPTDADISFLQKDLNLDEGLILDALDEDEVPRLEVENGDTFVYMRFAYKTAGGKIKTAPIMLEVSSKFFLSLSATPCTKLQLFAKNGTDYYSTQKSKLLLETLELLLDTYAQQLNTINKQIRAARGNLNVKRISNKDFVQFVEIEDVLNEFLGDLVPANNVLQKLDSRRKNLSFVEEDRDLLEDLQLSSTQLIDTIRGSLKTIVNIREAYSNIVTNNLNRQIKVLTTLTVVLTVPTIVGSFWGMNVAVPGHDNPMAFVLIIFSAIGFSGLTLALFRRTGWL